MKQLAVMDSKKNILSAIRMCGEEGATSPEIEKKVNMERHTLSKYLSIMEREGSLSYKQVGRGRIWFVNKTPFQKIARTKESSMTFNEKLILNLTSKMPVGIIVVDRDYNVHFANDIALKLYGMILGEKFYKSVLGLNSPASLKKINEFIDNSKDIAELKVSDRLGNILNIKCSRMANPDGSASMILILYDITKEELAKEELKKSYERLKEIDNLKSAILMDVARDLKQPVSLTAMSASLMQEEIGKKDFSREKLAGYLDILLRNTKMFEEQLASILQLSRVKAENNMNREKVKLAEIINDVAKEYEKVAKEKGIEIKAMAGSAPQINASRDLIASLVKNLVSNAVKFTKKGSVEINCRKEGSNAVISVKDSGIGIKKPDSERIFEPFTKLEKSSEGLGIGLTICREVVDLYSGSINVKSVPGKGSTFTVVLPLQR